MEGEQAAVQQPNLDTLGNIIKSAMDGLGDKFETSVTGFQNDRTNPKVKKTYFDAKGKNPYDDYHEFMNLILDYIKYIKTKARQLELFMIVWGKTLFHW